MKTKYMINNNEMIINIDSLYNLKNDINNFDNIREYINFVIKENNINFNGNKIIVYQNGLLIGTLYLTNYYLKKMNSYKKENKLTNNNSYFYENEITEISSNHNKKITNV